MSALAVILSVYKNDKIEYFQPCIESLLNQTYSGADIWIQFDGVVSDSIGTYLAGLNNEHIFVRKRSENRGLACSLNELLGEVLQKEYRYIARMDADDECMPDRFRRQIEFMEAHPQCDICGSFIEETDESGASAGVVEYPLEHDAMKAFFGRRNPLAHMSVMFRRSYFDKAGLYPTDTNKDEDTMFWLKGFLSGCVFANVGVSLVRVRVNDDFYCRRNGFAKSWADMKNRCIIIRSLSLSPLNYLLAFGRFLFFSFPMPRLTRLAYRYLR
ncbi:MAG: glycosyltransferase [Alistipes sp.]|nr:glycosyltransferase [Alistipes senegalensis]MCM1249561.1 glycosyltransferase [Alistipes sp.]